MISFEYRRRSSLPSSSSSSFFTFISSFLASSFISASRQNSSSRKSPPTPSPSSQFSITPFYSLFSFLSILTALNLVDIAQAQSPVPPSPSPASSSPPSTTDNNDNSNGHGDRNDRNNNSDIDPNLMAAAAPAPLPTSSGGRPPRPPVQSSASTINVVPSASTIFSTAAPLPTTTTTTVVHTFSDHIITVDVPTSSNNGVVTSTANLPTETPYGWTDDKNTNGGLMLTVSLVVVFVVLAGLILVVFCLFRRRSALARRQMRQLSKGASSSSVLENGHASNAGGKTGTTLRDSNNRHSFSGIRSTSGGGSRSSGIFLANGGAGLAGSNASQNGSGIGTPGTGSNYGASEIDINRALQEMSELHQSHRLSKRSSTLSLGHSRMLSPVMSAAAVAGARPPSLMGSGYYSGSNSGTPGGPGTDSNSRANSFVMGGGSSSTGTGSGGDYISGHLLESSSSSGPSEFRNSQYDEHNGRVSPLPQPPHHQQQQEFMQEPSPQLLGTGQGDVAAGSVQTTDRVMSPPSSLLLTPQVHVHPFPQLNRSTGHLPMHGERPHSMMVAPQSSSTLVIPPSITTRRRSMMNTNNMYVAQAGQRPPSFIAQQQQPAYYASSPPPPQLYQQQQHHSIYPSQPYQFQQYDNVDSPYESSPAATDSTQRGHEEGISTSAATAADFAIHSTGKLDPKREEDREDGIQAEAIGAGVGSRSPSSSLLLGTVRRSSNDEAQPKVVIPSPPQTTAIVPLPDTTASVATGPSASDSEMTHSSTIFPA